MRFLQLQTNSRLQIYTLETSTQDVLNNQIRAVKLPNLSSYPLKNFLLNSNTSEIYSAGEDLYAYHLSNYSRAKQSSIREIPTEETRNINEQSVDSALLKRTSSKITGKADTPSKKPRITLRVSADLFAGFDFKQPAEIRLLVNAPESAASSDFVSENLSDTKASTVAIVRDTRRQSPLIKAVIIHFVDEVHDITRRKGAKDHGNSDLPSLVNEVESYTKVRENWMPRNAIYAKSAIAWKTDHEEDSLMLDWASADAIVGVSLSRFPNLQLQSLIRRYYSSPEMPRGRQLSAVANSTFPFCCQEQRENRQNEAIPMTTS